jgi:hypothetical protein
MSGVKPPTPLKGEEREDGRERGRFGIQMGRREWYWTGKERKRRSHGRKSRGGTGGQIPQNLQWGDANTGCPPDFCHVSKFQALAMDSSPPPPPDFNPDLRHWTELEGLYKRKGWKERKGSGGRSRRKEDGDGLVSKQISWIRHCIVQCHIRIN